MSWLSGSCAGLPGRAPGAGDVALSDLLMEVATDSFKAGRATERGDLEGAQRLNRRVLVAVAQIRLAVATSAPSVIRNSTEPA